MARFQTGYFKNGCSYIRFGKGEEKIVIFPPLNDALFELTAFPLYFEYLFRGLIKNYSVYIVSRKRRLSIGHTTREMAEDYAEAFKSVPELDGPHTILGISLGGMIAQHFAFDFPEHVKRLVLIASGYRMGPEGLQIARRWIPWAKLRMWKEIYEDTVDISYRGVRRFFLRFLEPVFAQYLSHRVADPADFIIAGQAGIIHDSFEILPQLVVPTLIIAGTHDPFFPEKIFYDMNELMPQSELLIFKDSRHGVYEENKSKCVKTLLEWMKKPGVPVTSKRISLKPDDKPKNFLRF